MGQARDPLGKGYICPVCKKSFWVFRIEDWAYKRGQHGKFTKIPLCSWKYLREYDKLKEVNKGKLNINKYANSEDYQEETICDRIKESLEIAGADGLTPQEIREVIFLCCGKVYSLPTLYRRLEVLSDGEEIMAVGSRNKSRIWKLRGAGD